MSFVPELLNNFIKFKPRTDPTSNPGAARRLTEYIAAATAESARRAATPAAEGEKLRSEQREHRIREIVQA